MKATGIARGVDDLGRIVISKKIRRTLRSREGGPLLTTLTVEDRYLHSLQTAMKQDKGPREHPPQNPYLIEEENTSV